MRGKMLAALVILTIAAPSFVANAAAVTIGIVADGGVLRAMILPEFILSEARNVLGSEFEIRIPENTRLGGGWTREGIRAALDRQLSDPEVDFVPTLGLLSSYEAAHREPLSKPVIAPFVTDPVLQGYPLKDGRSGPHFVYVASFQSVAEELRLFQRVVRFRRGGNP